MDRKMNLYKIIYIFDKIAFKYIYIYRVVNLKV